MSARRFTAIILLIFPVGLILISIWVIIKTFEPKKPAFFRQERIGKDGKVFLMWKIRTLDQIDYPDAISGPADPRITPIGKVIRKSHLDELIQIINVANGSMAFIGPRPTLKGLSMKLEEEVPGYIRRYAVLPGITGLKQINGRCGTQKELVLDRLLMRKLPDMKFRLWIAYHTTLRVLKLKGDI